MLQLRKQRYNIVIQDGVQVQYRGILLYTYNKK